MVKQAKRTSRPTQHRPKITVAEIDTFHDYCIRPNSAATGHRLLAVCLVAFGGFLRVSEATSLRHEDLPFTSSCVTIVVRSSKCQQLGIGVPPTVIISRTASKLCPVSHLQQWLREAPSSEFVFPSFSDPNRNISASAILSQLKKTLLSAGITRNPEAFWALQLSGRSEDLSLLPDSYRPLRYMIIVLMPPSTFSHAFICAEINELSYP